MVTLLCRGKQTENNKWVEGYYVCTHNYLDNREIHLMFCDDSTVYPHNEITGTVEVDPKTIGRFTGLTDKNGVKIFEGDVVHLSGDKGTDTRFINYNALVVFRHGGFCAIDGTPDDYCVCRFDFTSSLNCEIIGNVYDNLELIEDGDT